MSRNHQITKESHNSKYFNLILRAFIPGDMELNYFEESNEVVAKGMRFKIPDSYKSAPFLGIYYIKELINNNRLPDPENVEWPNPGTIVSTVLARSEEHTSTHSLQFSSSLKKSMFGDVKAERNEDGSLITLETQTESEATSNFKKCFDICKDPTNTHRDVTAILKSLNNYEEAIKATGGKKQIEIKFFLKDYLVADKQVGIRIKAFKIFLLASRISTGANLNLSELTKELESTNLTNMYRSGEENVFLNGIHGFGSILDESKIFQMGILKCQMRPLTKLTYHQKWRNTLIKYDPSNHDRAYPVIEELFLDILRLNFNEDLSDEIDLLTAMFKFNQRCIFELCNLIDGFKKHIELLSRTILEPLGLSYLTKDINVEGDESITYYCESTKLGHLINISVSYTPEYTDGIIDNVRTEIKMRLIPTTNKEGLCMISKGVEQKTLKRVLDDENTDDNLPMKKDSHNKIVLEQANSVEQDEPIAAENIIDLTIDSEYTTVVENKPTPRTFVESSDNKNETMSSNEPSSISVDTIIQSPQNTPSTDIPRVEALADNSKVIQRLCAEALQLRVTVASLKATIEQQKRQLREKDNIIAKRQRILEEKEAATATNLNKLTKQKVYVKHLEYLLKKLGPRGVDGQ